MKERLTGAIILVALVVLLVPELLTGPVDVQPPQADGVGSEGPPLRSYTIELAEDSKARRPPPTATPEVPRPQETERKAEAPGQPAPVASSQAAGPVAEEKPAAAPAPSSPSGSAVEPAKAPARETRQAAAPAPVVTGWAVQVGSFTSRENADRLAEELRRQGYSVFIREGASNGRRLYRVRVGPERDRSAAQALAAKLRKAGRTTAIVPHP